MNAIDDKLYARTEKFISNMNNLLIRLKGEATKIAKRQVEPPKSSGGEIIGALAIGITIGAAASLLLAPRSGKETRDKIATNFKDVSNKVMDWEKKQGEKLQNLEKEGEKTVKQKTTT